MLQKDSAENQPEIKQKQKKSKKPGKTTSKAQCTGSEVNKETKSDGDLAQDRKCINGENINETLGMLSKTIGDGRAELKR